MTTQRLDTSARRALYTLEQLDTEQITSAPYARLQATAALLAAAERRAHDVRSLVRHRLRVIRESNKGASQ